MTMNNLNLARAKFAVVKVSSQTPEYKSAIKKLIPLVQSSGLIATLMFAKVKGSEYNVVYQHTCEWFQKQQLLPVTSELPVEHAIGYLLSLGSTAILSRTIEALKILSWLKRSADDLIPD